MEAGIARGTDVHHGWHVEFHHLFVELVPPPVGQRRRGPVAARRIGIEVAAHETEFLHAAFELSDATIRGYARRLRQLAYADEVVGIERADAVDHLIAQLRPSQAHVVIADVMTHAHGARRKDGEVGTAFALELELDRKSTRLNSSHLGISYAVFCL